MDKKHFYISTAVPYVNLQPHLGFALEIVQADVIARYHRILGEKVFFLTGTDENSLKNVRAAEQERISTKELVDRNAKKFFDLKKALNLSFDDFIRTTEDRHIRGAQKFWQACEKDIYKKKYKGFYCVGCDEFYKENELKNGFCPEHKTKPEIIEEENYFFKLSKYQEQIKKIIESDEVKIIPRKRKNEVLNFINSGLEDICISRLAQRGRGWGIPVPEDTTQILWTWFDALSNYITALGYAKNSQQFKKWWQDNKNILHIVGKGILRFHTVYWLGLLLSAGLNLPKQIFVHGYLTFGGQKMSKSLGNIIDPFELVKKYGTDAVRYFLLREISPTEDGDFTIEKFEARFNSDLAAGIGNLVARVLTLAEKSKKEDRKYKITIQNSDLNKLVKEKWKDYQKSLDNFKFNEALAIIWQLISFCDKYIERERPWENSNKQLSIINDLLIALANIVQMLKPFLPETSEKIFNQLGGKKEKDFWQFEIKKAKKVLFPKI